MTTREERIEELLEALRGAFKPRSPAANLGAKSAEQVSLAAAALVAVLVLDAGAGEMKLAGDDEAVAAVVAPARDHEDPAVL